MKEDIWTIEINLDEDYAYACAYHIDLLTNVSALNLREACEKKKTSRWAIVGIATTIESANEQCKLIREELCKMHNREIYGIGLEDSLRKDVPISITVSALGNVFAKLTAKYKFEKNRVLEEMSKALDYYNEEEEEK